VTMEQVFLRVLQFSPFSIIPSMLHDLRNWQHHSIK